MNSIPSPPEHPANGRSALVSLISESDLRRIIAEELDAALADVEERLRPSLSPPRSDAGLFTTVGPMLTEREVAALLSCHPRTVRRLESRGELPPALRVGGSKRWARKVVEEWIAGLAEGASRQA